MLRTVAARRLAFSITAERDEYLAEFARYTDFDWRLSKFRICAGESRNKSRTSYRGGLVKAEEESGRKAQELGSLGS